MPLRGADAALNRSVPMGTGPRRGGERVAVGALLSRVVVEEPAWRGVLAIRLVVRAEGIFESSMGFVVGERACCSDWICGGILG